MVLFAVIVIYTTISEDSKSIFGYRIFIIKTGSMQSTINVGDLILTRNPNKNKLNIGDVITFISPDPQIWGMINTHRINDIKDEYYYTKGDASDFIDQIPVKYDDILGEVIFKSTLGGKIVLWASKPLNMLLFILLPVVLLLYFETESGKKKLRHIFSRVKKKNVVNDEREILKSLLMPEQKAFSSQKNNQITQKKEFKNPLTENSESKIPANTVLNILYKDVYIEKKINEYIKNLKETQKNNNEK